MEHKVYIFNEHGVCKNPDLLFESVGKNHYCRICYALVDGKYYFSHMIELHNSGFRSPLSVDGTNITDFLEGVKFYGFYVLEHLLSYKKANKEVSGFTAISELEDFLKTFGQPKTVQMQLF